VSKFQVDCACFPGGIRAKVEQEERLQHLQQEIGCLYLQQRQNILTRPSIPATKEKQRFLATKKPTSAAAYTSHISSW